MFVTPARAANFTEPNTRDSGAGSLDQAVVKGVVYVGSEDGSVYALNAATDEILWVTSIGG